MASWHTSVAPGDTVLTNIHQQSRIIKTYKAFHDTLQQEWDEMF